MFLQDNLWTFLYIEEAFPKILGIFGYHIYIYIYAIDISLLYDICRIQNQIQTGIYHV